MVTVLVFIAHVGGVNSKVNILLKDTLWCHFKNTPVVVNNPIDNESFLKVD